jgi:hypothetical protein
MTALREFRVGPILFTRRPLSEGAPPDGTLCIVDNGNDCGWTDRSPACLRNAEWSNGRGRKLRFEPTYWITWKGSK